MNHITHLDRQRPPPITYGCICSGLSAPTLAAKPLGWKTAFFSEIEAFPRAVLAHHYPGVPLHGDFTTIEWNTYGTVDLLVGGTARAIHWPEDGLAWMTRAATSRLSMFAWLNELMPSGWRSRTSPVFYQAPAEKTSPLSSQPLPGMSTDLPPPDGRTPVLPKAAQADGASHGAYLTLSISEWPKDAVVCSLSDIVETGDQPQRYYLSPKACAGILRRADNRGRRLPEHLSLALRRAAMTLAHTEPPADT